MHALNAFPARYEARVNFISLQIDGFDATVPTAAEQEISFGINQAAGHRISEFENSSARVRSYVPNACGAIIWETEEFSFVVDDQLVDAVHVPEPRLYQSDDESTFGQFHFPEAD